MKTRAWLKVLLPILVLVAITAAVSAPVYFQRIMNPTTDDYDAHIVWTLKMTKFKLPPISVIAVPLYELVVGFMYWAGRGLLGLYETAALEQVLAQIAAALVLYFWIGPIRRRWGETQRIFWSLSLTLVAPVMLLWFVDHQFYFGYIGLASYHNPTVHLLRPFALLQFIFAVRIFRLPPSKGGLPLAKDVPLRSPGWIVLLSAGITLAAMLAKPNFGIAFLPALAVMTAWFLWKKRRLDWRLLILGQIVPFIIAFAFQLILIHLIPDPEGSGIMLSFFGAESVWSSYLPLKLLLSLLFPLSVLFLLRRRIHLDDEVILALIAFGISLIHLYFFAESGDRFPHGNFRWGAQITLFILFAVLARRLIALAGYPPNGEGDPLSRKGLFSVLPPPERLRLWPAYGMYLLHLAAGIAYYIYAYVQPNYN